MSEDRGALLMDACNHVMEDPGLAPEYDKKTGKITVTHCNRGALLIAQAMGCREFDTTAGMDPLTADQMILLMASNESGRWKNVNGRGATLHALDGGLAFAVKSSHELGDAHGHIAAVFPAGMQWSGSWKRDVPLVANVGRENKEEKASQAFPAAKGEPAYFAWS